MKRLIFLLAFIFMAGTAFAQPGRAPLNIREQDGSPDTYPYRLKVSNGTLTNHGDGTVSLVVPAVDTTDKLIEVSDGTVTVGISLRHSLHGPLSLTGAYTIDNDYPLIFLDSTVFPQGMMITAWYISSTVADPTTELDANLMYCDAPGTGAFPGANAVLIDVMDTTTGNASETDMSQSDLGSGNIPAGKWMYIDMDANPTDTDDYWLLNIEYYIKTS